MAHGCPGGQHSCTCFSFRARGFYCHLLGEPSEALSMPRGSPCIIAKPVLEKERNGKTIMRDPVSHYHSVSVTA